MPLRDHFRSPLDDETSWEGLHGAWPTVIVMALNRKLPRFMYTFPNEIVTCQLPDRRKRRVFIKYEAGRGHHSFGHRGGVTYEANTEGAFNTAAKQANVKGLREGTASTYTTGLNTIADDSRLDAS